MNQKTHSPQAKSKFGRYIWLVSVVAALIVFGVVAAVWKQGRVSNGQGISAGTLASQDTSLAPAPAAGHPAPTFTLSTPDGRQITLSDFEGRPVILNFWASWCGPCRLEMPHLQEAYAAHGGDVVVLGVNLTKREGDRATIPAFIEEFGLTFPVVLDEEGSVANLYEVRGQPASVFIDANGTVRTVFYGPVNQDFINTQIDQLFES